MFKNLRAEMARNDIKQKDIAKCIGVSERTFRNYLAGTSKISWLDTVKIKKTFFPNMSMEYLFNNDDKTQKVS